MLKKLEIAANLSIIVVCALLVAVVIRQQQAPKQQGQRPAITLGSRFSIGEAAHPSGRTLFVALKPGCRFCTESAHFYQRLLTRVRTISGVRLVVLVPHDSLDGDKYVAELGMAGVSAVRKVHFSDLKILATPTLILTASTGQVEGVWQGRLKTPAEEDVMRALQERDAAVTSVR
jgi:hypothetical protein